MVAHANFSNVYEALINACAKKNESFQITNRSKLKICVIDLVSKEPAHTLWARIMHVNLASIMPQVVITWCEQEGHDANIGLTYFSRIIRCELCNFFSELYNNFQRQTMHLCLGVL